MNIKQVSIFLENKKGRLADVTKLLAANRINIRALSLADAAEFGVLRLIVNDPDFCLKILKENQFVAQSTDVIAVEVPDEPGGLQKVLDVLQAQDLNIEYMYAFVEKKVANAIVIFRIDDYQKAVKALQSQGLSVLSHDVIKNL